MVEYFYPDQQLHLPELSERFGLYSDRFIVRLKFEGGMGTCYKIEDENGKHYALKVIHSDLILNELSMLRYYEELKLWLTFSACDAVAEALSLTRINGIPCVVSAWMEHGDMTSLLQSKDKSLFYRTFDRIITGLKWVNDRYHVIHRDLKPGNILLDSENRAYVADWGLAKLVSDGMSTVRNSATIKNAKASHLTQEGSFLGTIIYASPEQIMGRTDIDHRSDIYSLGCMMYEWETGRPPFVANTIEKIATAHVNTKPRKIGGFLSSTNFKAESIIMKCLEKDPADRYQTYDEMLAALRTCAQKITSNFTPHVIKERSIPVNIGHDELIFRIKSENIGVVGSQNLSSVDFDEVEPYLKEALSLKTLGEYSKCAAIYSRLFFNEMISKFPDLCYNQHIAINYANCLNLLGKPQEALEVISTISDARVKPATYYVNLSNIYISSLEFQKCYETAREGLNKYPHDKDLLGNQTIALTELGRFDEAIRSANERLKYDHDIPAICEAAHIQYKQAESLKNTEFPKAVDLYKKALRLFKSALEINPAYADALYNVALILFKMKRYTDAMNFGSKISNIEHGTSAVNAFYAARNMLWVSAFESGLKFCDNWLKTYPDSIMLQRVRAEILVDGYVIDNYTKDGLPIVERSSLDFFSKIIKDEKHRIPTDLIFLAKIHCWMNEDAHIDYGIRLLEWGERNYPYNWKFNFYLAAFAHKYGDYEEALSQALKCKSKAPWRESIYSLLAKIYSAKGDEAAALRMRSEYARIKKEKDALYESCKNL